MSNVYRYCVIITIASSYVISNVCTIKLTVVSVINLKYTALVMKISKRYAEFLMLTLNSWKSVVLTIMAPKIKSINCWLLFSMNSNKQFLTLLMNANYTVMNILYIIYNNTRKLSTFPLSISLLEWMGVKMNA